MRLRWIILAALLAVFAVACSDDDPELSTDSTLVTGPSGTDPATEATTTTQGGNGDNGETTPTTLVGQTVGEFQVASEIPNENGVEQLIIIPEGAYTDVDLQNFVLDLLEQNPDLYGAEIFDAQVGVDAFMVPEEDRTEEQTAALNEHWFVTVTGRDRMDFQGPFAEFPGAAIGS